MAPMTPDTSTNQHRFSYRGVPAATGMCDCYESPTLILLRGLRKAIGDSRR